MKDNMHNNDTPAELVLKIVSSRKGDQKNKQTKHKSCGRVSHRFAFAFLFTDYI